MLHRLLEAALEKARCKADEVAARTREVLEGLPTPFFAKKAPAAVLSRALEQQPAEAASLQSFYELIVRWIAQLSTSSEDRYFLDGQSPFTGDITTPSPWLQTPQLTSTLTQTDLFSKGLSFRHVFLGSQALEIAFLRLTRLDDQDASARGAFAHLLKLCLVEDAAPALSDLITLGFSLRGLPEKALAVRCSLELVAILKRDWALEALEGYIRQDRASVAREKENLEVAVSSASPDHAQNEEWKVESDKAENLVKAARSLISLEEGREFRLQKVNQWASKRWKTLLKYSAENEDIGDEKVEELRLRHKALLAEAQTVLEEIQAIEFRREFEVGGSSPLKEFKTAITNTKAAVSNRLSTSIVSTTNPAILEGVLECFLCVETKRAQHLIEQLKECETFQDQLEKSKQSKLNQLIALKGEMAEGRATPNFSHEEHDRLQLSIESVMGSLECLTDALREARLKSSLFKQEIENSQLRVSEAFKDVTKTPSLLTAFDKFSKLF